MNINSWILIATSTLVFTHANADAVSEKEKAYFLRITDNSVFKLKTNPAWESFRKKKRFGGMFYRYNYSVKSTTPNKRYDSIAVIQLTKVAWNIPGASAGDMGAMLLGFKMGLRDSKLRMIHTTQSGNTAWNLYDIANKDKVIGSAILARSGHVTTLYTLFGIRLNKKTASILATALIKKAKSAK